MSKQKSKPLFEYRSSALDGAKILKNIIDLQNQIDAQFPERGLSSTVQDLGNEAKAASDLSNRVGGSHTMAWFFNITIPILVFIITLSVALYYLNSEDKEAFNGFDDIDGLINLIFLSVVIGVLFRQTVKLRRRNIAMKQLHLVRTLIHVLDMKQQNKKIDGKCLTNQKPLLSISESILYLDDCSQAVVLAGKVAALLIEDYDDSLVIATVSEIDALCNGITNRIWLKIQVFQLTHRTAVRNRIFSQ
jgi:hypothetical protein